MSVRLLAAAPLVLLLLTPAVFAETTLSPKFKELSSYKTKETTKVHQILKVNGQPIETAASSVIVSEAKVGQRTAEGDLSIETTYAEIQTEVTLPGNAKVSYNSVTGEEKSDNPNYQIVLDKLKALKGLKFTIVLDKDNRVKAVEGLTPDSGASPEDIKISTQQSLDRFPKEPVKAGEQWEREMIVPLGSGQIFTLKRKYTYVGPEVRSTVASTKTLQKVTAASSDLQFSIRPNAGLPITVTKSDLKMDTGESTALFDAARGQTVEAVEKMHVTGSLVLTAMGLELNGDLDLTMETKAEVLK